MRWVVSTHAVIRFSERATGVDPRHVDRDLRLGLQEAVPVERKTLQNSLLFRCDRFYCYFVGRQNRYGPGMVVRTVLGWGQGQRYEKSTTSYEETLQILQEEEVAVGGFRKEIVSLKKEIEDLKKQPWDLLLKDLEVQESEIREAGRTTRHQISMAKNAPLLDYQKRVRSALEEAFRESDLENAKLKLETLLPELSCGSSVSRTPTENP